MWDYIFVPQSKSI